MSWTREAAVAGTFYPDREEVLRATLKGFEDRIGTQEKQTVIAIIVPHAGYIYSGRFAAEVYFRTEIPDTIIVLCPNHTGMGKRISLWTKGEWKTPLGTVKVDEEVAAVLASQNKAFEEDRQAHLREHAIEVQIPFLQWQNPQVKIVPVTMGHINPGQCREVGKALNNTVRTTGKKIMMVASTDMSHYVDAETAKEKDALALEAIEKLDGPSLYHVVTQQEISMCGFIPTASVLEASSLLGAKKSNVLAYGNSGDVTTDYSSVVAYAAAQIPPP